MPRRRRILDGSATSAGIYDYLLGGNSWRLADQHAAGALVRAKPRIGPNIRANRRAMRRMVQFAAARGITQFLDIGSGLPSMDNTQEIAQAANPAARVVSVDNDPRVAAHARALVTGTPQGRADYVTADLASPAEILERAARTLDMTRPLAIILFAVLQFIPDDDEAYQIVKTLTGALPPGGMLALSHPASDLLPAESAAGASVYEQATGLVQANRALAQVTRFFDGLALISPGVVRLNLWRPDALEDPAELISSYTGAGIRR
ncbi:MAG: SAM-dependent methyltransferase [Streptosporangiaceae bacterium]